MNMNVIDEFASRIETQLKVTDAPGMDIRFTMNRDAAAAYVEQLRATSTLLQEYERLREVLADYAKSEIYGARAREALGVAT